MRQIRTNVTPKKKRKFKDLDRYVEDYRGRSFQSQTQGIINNVYKYMLKEKEMGGYLIAPSRLRDRTAAACGIGKDSVTKYRNLALEDAVFKTPGKLRKRKAPKRTVDEDIKNRINETVYNAADSRRTLNVDQILTEFKNSNPDANFEGGRETFRKVLHDIDYKYAKRDGRRYVMEEPDIQMKKRKFLQVYVSNYMKSDDDKTKLTPIFQDETWTFSHGTGKTKEWSNNDRRSISMRKASSGARFIICNAGSKHGFVNGASLFFKSKANPKEGEDYHGDMTAEVFNKWIGENFLPAIPFARALIIFDNASYHSVIKNPHPTTQWKKDKIREWLNERGINFSSKAIKKTLLDICELHREGKSYVVEAIVAEKTPQHKILRTPPYHYFYNPIEMIWGIAKRKFDKQVGRNNDFSETAIKNMWQEVLNEITPDVWHACVKKTEYKIFMDYLDIFRGQKLEDFQAAKDNSSMFDVKRKLFKEADDEINQTQNVHKTENLQDMCSNPDNKVTDDELQAAIASIRSQIPDKYRDDFEDEFNSKDIDIFYNENYCMNIDEEADDSNGESAIINYQYGVDMKDVIEIEDKSCNNDYKDCNMEVDDNEEYVFQNLAAPIERKIFYKTKEDLGNPKRKFHTSVGIDFTTEQLYCLFDKQWLNDQVIDIYIKLISQRAGPSVHVFDSTFFTKLSGGSHRKVKGHTKNLILNYLSAEYEAKKLTILNRAAWKEDSVTSIPKQSNDDDCGVFTCIYAKHICAEEKMTFSQANMKDYRIEILNEIMSTIITTKETIKVPEVTKDKKDETKEINTRTEPQKDFLLAASASYHQADKTIFIHNNVNAQCTGIATYAIMMLSVPNLEVDEGLMNWILIEGDKYYMHCFNAQKALRESAGKEPEKWLNTDELKTIRYENLRISIEVKDISQGYFNKENLLSTIEQAINNCVNANEQLCGFLFIGQSKTVSFKVLETATGPLFLLFNSHSVNENNEYEDHDSEGSRARLFLCQNAKALANLIIRNAVYDNRPWQISKIKFLVNRSNR